MSHGLSFEQLLRVWAVLSSKVEDNRQRQGGMMSETKGAEEAEAKVEKMFEYGYRKTNFGPH